MSRSSSRWQKRIIGKLMVGMQVIVLLVSASSLVIVSILAYEHFHLGNQGSNLDSSSVSKNMVAAPPAFTSVDQSDYEFLRHALESLKSSSHANDSAISNSIDFVERTRCSLVHQVNQVSEAY